MKEYALIWFEGEDPFTMVNKEGKTVLLSKEEALRQVSSLLENQDDVDKAEDDLRYGIASHLLEELYGWKK